MIIKAGGRLFKAPDRFISKFKMSIIKILNWSEGVYVEIKISIEDLGN